MTAISAQTILKHTFQVTLNNDGSIMHAKKLIENALKEPAISEGSHAEIHVTGIFGPKDLYVEVYFITYHTNTMNAIKSFLNENPDLYDQWYYQSELKIL